MFIYVMIDGDDEEKLEEAMDVQNDNTTST